MPANVILKLKRKSKENSQNEQKIFVEWFGFLKLRKFQSVVASN